MRRFVFWAVTTLVIGSLCITGARAHDAGEDVFPPGDDASPVGRVDDRAPHDACETCFTVPGLVSNTYHIFERMQVGADEHIIPRLIPNPAPLRDDELLRDDYDEETGEPIWYIGDQAHVGPTDEEPFSADYPVPLIDLKVIHRRHMDAILAVPGVHGFGIGLEGFTVAVTPADGPLAAAALPTTIEGVPVTITLEAPSTLLNHQDTEFRPVPVGAAISVIHGIAVGPDVPYSNGTLGPHIVRTEQNIATCCQILALTAGHVAKALDEAMPTPGTRIVLQPVLSSLNRKQMGTVRHAFTLLACNTPADPDCERASAPTNWTWENPDIAVIDPLPTGNFNPVPHNTPTDTDLTRHLQRSASSYINGPSGKIMEASTDHNHLMWGAVTPALSTGRVVEVNRAEVIEDVDKKYFKVCCINRVTVEGVGGDSGALVSYAGRGNRHIAGVAIAGDPDGGIWYIPADDIKTALSDAGLAFHHYWGTKEDYRKPSTKTCDLPDGC